MPGLRLLFLVLILGSSLESESIARIYAVYLGHRWTREIGNAFFIRGDEVSIVLPALWEVGLQRLLGGFSFRNVQLLCLQLGYLLGFIGGEGFGVIWNWQCEVIVT